MDKTKLRQIWIWFASQLDTRLVTNVAVGAILGLVALEVIKFLITLAAAVVAALVVLLFS